MSLVFRRDHIPLALARLGEATVLDVTRRTDPARVDGPWENLRAVLEHCPVPWIVQLWTKDLESALARGGPLVETLRGRGTTFAVQWTVTGLGGTAWEPLVPPEPFRGLETCLARIGGPDHVKWRFDPVLPLEGTVERFQRLATVAARAGIQRCVVNFVAPPGRYRRVDARLAGLVPGWDQGLPDFSDPWREARLRELVEVARGAGTRVSVCAESAALAHRVAGVGVAACGDAPWFATLSGRSPAFATGRGSRAGCGCAPYLDVGQYGQWSRCHRCAYCYAG